jgi:hypothetical protein
MTSHSFAPCRSISAGALLLLSLLQPSTQAADGTCCADLDVRQLGKFCPHQLEDLFRAGTMNGVPVGYAKGRPLLMLDYRNPKLRATMGGAVWKGKHFRTDGTMINQWVGFRAVEATISIEPSALDGQPCVRLDYPAVAPAFGNSFDELREIAPCVWLGCFYERCPTPRLKGYFVLESSPR